MTTHFWDLEEFDFVNILECARKLMIFYFRLPMCQSLVQAWNGELWWAMYSQHPSPMRIWPIRCCSCWQLWKAWVGIELLKEMLLLVFWVEYWLNMWRREKALITASRSPLTWLWVERYLLMNLFHAILVQYSLSKQTWIEWQIKQAPRRVRVYADGIYDLFHQVPFSTHHVTCDFQYVWNS